MIMLGRNTSSAQLGDPGSHPQHGCADVGAAGVCARQRGWVAAAALALAACQPGAPRIPPPAGIGVPAAPAAAPAPRVALPGLDLPPGPIYRCAIAGSQSVLALSENIESLCRRHPEMGPCQYEREGCRQRGGRVYTSKGDEVTAAVEAEYDKRVRRVRFQADGAPKR
jgi:hypothetical protein